MIVSFCVVAFNEELYLDNLLKDIKKQTYSHECIEIVLVDSGSIDNTKKIMEEFKKNNNDFNNVCIYDNKKKIQSAGWNIAITNAIGDIIIRVDAHSKVPDNFVEENVDCIKSGEAVCGGIRPCLINNQKKWSEVLLSAELSMFGSSIASYRHNSKKAYVNSLFHAAYKREVFEKIGGFNEFLGRTEDNELHYRINEAGYKICLDTNIISYQYIRPTLIKMLRQKFGNGYWIGLTLAVCPRCLKWYHFVPMLFVISVLISTLLLFLNSSILFILICLTYLIANLIISIKTFLSTKLNPFNLVLPLLFLLLHLSYGFGTLCGIANIPFWVNKEDARSNVEGLLVKDKMKIKI